MKNLFALIAILLSSLIYGQESINPSVIENITFRPLEVFASGVLIMDLKNPTNVKYLISRGANVILEKNIIDANGRLEEKMDLSTLENGEYFIRVFIESTEVKSIFFKKS